MQSPKNYSLLSVWSTLSTLIYKKGTAKQLFLNVQTFSMHDTCRCKWLFKKKKPSQNAIKVTITDTCFLFNSPTQVEFFQSLSGVYIFFLRPFYNHLNPRPLTKIITIILTIYCNTWARDLRQHESNFLDPLSREI